MKRTLIALLTLLLSAVVAESAGTQTVKLGRVELIGSISRDNHVYHLHLQHSIKLDGADNVVTDVRLVDTKSGSSRSATP